MENSDYYKYIGETQCGFTHGKLYKIIDKSNIDKNSNFIDDYGVPNGWCGSNKDVFTPCGSKNSVSISTKDTEYLFKLLESRGIKW